MKWQILELAKLNSRKAQAGDLIKAATCGRCQAFGEILRTLKPFARAAAMVAFALRVVVQSCFAGAGAPDLSFNPGSGLSTNSLVDVLLELSDGRIACGGSFSNYDGVSRRGIVLLYRDGSVDGSFNPGSSADASILCLAQQGDGKLLLGGGFNGFSGRAVSNLVRLNLNGSVDDTFQIGTGADSAVSGIQIDQNGRIWVSGLFTNFNGMPSSSLIRLNPDGSRDPSFDCQVRYVFAMSLDPNSGALIAGFFTNVNGFPTPGIARLTQSGGLDTAFHVGDGPSNPIFSVYSYPDGRFLVGGGFTSYDGTPRTNVARLLPNGYVDDSFVPDPRSAGAYLFRNALVVQDDGKVLVAGRTNLLRLTSSGIADSTFNAPAITGFFPKPPSILPICQRDGRILVGGQFVCLGIFTNLMRLHGDLTESNQVGSIGRTFNPSDIPTNASLKSMSTDKNKRVLVTGRFTAINGRPYSGIARFLPNGALDTSFTPGDGVGSDGLAPGSAGPWTKYQTNGQIFVYGTFTSFDSSPRKGIARLNPNGAMDANFIPPALSYAYVRDVVPDPVSGGVYMCGRFPIQIRGTNGGGIARLDAVGAVDSAFSPGFGVDTTWTVYSAALQRDRKLLIAGNFLQVNNRSRPYIARLNPNGSVDMSFGPVLLGGSINGLDSPAIDTMVLQPDGRILIGGSFTTVLGVFRPGIARLLPDGSVDFSFDPGQGFQGNLSVDWLELDASGGVFVCGWFARVNGAARMGLARLNSDGSLDHDFNPRFSTNYGYSVSRCSLYADGTLFAMSDIYSNLNGVPTQTAGFMPGVTSPLQPHLYIGRNGDAPELAVHFYSGQSFQILTAPEVTGPWSILATNKPGFGGDYYYTAPSFGSASRRFFLSRNVAP